MRSQHHYLVFWTTTLLVTLTSQSSLAFRITPDQPGDSDRTYKYEEYYENRQGVTRLDAWPFPDPRRAVPGHVLEIKPGGTDGLRDLLDARFGQTWEFIPKGNLEGSFNVENYSACGADFACELDGFRVSFAVGAAFKLNYRPEGNDPHGSTVHWIQRVIANYDEQKDQVPIDRIDIPSNATTPYYDDYSSRANSTLFIDFPFVQDPLIYANHYFYAETYLVNEVPGGTIDPETSIVKRKVEIYSGVRWGWENAFTPKPPQPTKTFSDRLSSGYEVDNFALDGLTPGSKYYAWTKNDLPSNSCNPNTYLSSYNNKSILTNYDNDSSLVGDGFASALTGIVGSDGIINLDVRAANGGRRGEDKGNYELNVKVYSPEESPPELIVGGSGGGGVSRERPGGTQQTPILPNRSDGNWQVFSNVPSCRWYDPHTTHGFEFQALEDTLFTEILDFPVGLDNRFTVSVGDAILGEFGPGDSVDFVSLFGTGISNFKITDIDDLIGDTEATAFPIQLAFNDKVGSFQMREISETPDSKRLPEPTVILGLFLLAGWGVFQGLKIKNDK